MLVDYLPDGRLDRPSIS